MHESLSWKHAALWAQGRPIVPIGWLNFDIRSQTLINKLGFVESATYTFAKIPMYCVVLY